MLIDCFGRPIRRTRHSRLDQLGMFGTSDALATMGRLFGAHGETDTGAGTGGTGGSGSGTGGNAGGAGGQNKGKGGTGANTDGGEGDDDDDDDAKPVLSKAEKAKIVAARDRAKAEAAAIRDALGLTTRWEDDDENPGKKKLVVDGLDGLKKLRAEAEDADEAALKKKGDWDTRKAQLTTQHKAQLAAAKTDADKRYAGVTSLLSNLAKAEPLRAALAAEGAVDEHENDPAKRGQYADLLKLIGDRVQVRLDQDEDTGSASLTVQVLDEDGEPLLDGKGKPVAMRDFVRTWLDGRGHFRRANFRPGSGAGGHGGAGGQKASAGGRQAPATVKEHAKAEAGRLFQLML